MHFKNVIVFGCLIGIRMCTFQLFLGIDPSLGRLDYSLLSDQALTEMLFEGFDDGTKKEYQDEHGMYLDVCEWGSIKCDDDDRVIEILVFSDIASGSFDLRYVPPKVEALEIRPMTLCSSQLTGSVNLTGLPGGMEFLCLRSSRLTGEIDLTRLPEHIFRIDLPGNQLTGEIDLTQLPGRVEELSLGKNRLTGEIDLTQLPDEMCYLGLEGNRFTGDIDLTHLPEKMEYVVFSDNKLSGSLVLKHLPYETHYINAKGNNFNAVAVVHSKTHANIKLQESGVTSVVDENGKELHSKRFLE